MTRPAEMTGRVSEGPKVKEFKRQPLALKWRAENALSKRHSLRTIFNPAGVPTTKKDPFCPPQVYFRDVKHEWSRGG